MYTATRHIKYDADLDKNFAHDIRKMPGCENLDKCIQCGTCSGTCPLSIYMDLTPRRTIGLVRSGFKKEVLESSTIWLCTSCYACTVECPKEIGITDVMYALKRKAMEDKVYPKNFSIPVLAQEFFSMVRKKGRISESILVFKVFFKTMFLKMFGQSKLGMKLQSTGRFSLKSESVKNPRDIKKLFDSYNSKS